MQRGGKYFKCLLGFELRIIVRYTTEHVKVKRQDVDEKLASDAIKDKKTNIPACIWNIQGFI